MKKDKPENKPSLSEVRRAAAMKSAEVRRKKSLLKEPTTSVSCKKSDADRIRDISDRNSETIIDTVARCVDAYEEAHGK